MLHKAEIALTKLAKKASKIVELQFIAYGLRGSSRTGRTEELESLQVVCFQDAWEILIIFVAKGRRMISKTHV